MIDTSLFGDNEIFNQIANESEYKSTLDGFIFMLRETYSKEEMSDIIDGFADKMKDVIINDALAEDIVDIVDTICSKKSLKNLLDAFRAKSLLAMGALVNKELVLSMLGNINGIVDKIKETILEHDGWDETEGGEDE